MRCIIAAVSCSIMTGTLYIVPTPLGNLQDITIRAVNVLKTVEFIACEDTRRTGQLLKKLDAIQNPMLISFFEGNELKRLPNIMNLLINGKDVALVSDAGTPSVSDPGFRLVRQCVEEEIPIVGLPGPSAALLALTVSGLPTDKFMFLGYLPHKPGNRKKLLESVQQTLALVKQTVIFYVAPHKLVRTLEDVQSVFGDIDIVTCREMTKVHEEIRREKISESLTHFSKSDPKGEFTLLFHLP